MNTANAAEKLLALQAGRPVPTLGAWPFPRDARRLVLAFVRMAGETGVWGFVIGRPGAEPVVVTVPEPRNQDAAATLGLRLWEALSRELPHPSCFPAEDQDEQEWADAAGATAATWQLCLPGPGHVEMLHHLNYRWAQARKADPARIQALNALGRACGFLFRESTRPGQVRVLDLTARLRQAWAFPAEDLRQAHLGFLLGLLEGQGGFADRMARAAEEEKLAAGDTLDPELERKTLAPLLKDWGEAPAGARKDALAAEIHATLEKELRLRFDLGCRAIRAIDADPRPVNPNVGELLEAGSKAFVRDYFLPEVRHLEAGRRGLAAPFVPSPETDHHPASAARGFFAHQHDQEASGSALVHGDPVLAERALLAGDGVRGVIRQVGKPAGQTRPVWTLEVAGDGPLRLRAGSKVALLGLPQRHGKVLEIVAGKGGRQVVVQITNGIKARPADGAPAADAPALKGQEVVLVKASADGISMRKLKRLKELDGPGGWLLGNSGRPAPRLSAAAPSDLLQVVRKLEGGKKP